MNIRTLRPRDIADLKAVVDETGLFPGEILPDLANPYFDDPEGDSLWLVCEADRVATALCFAEAEPHTDGTWNMRALAVHPTRQRLGQGRALVAALEPKIKARGVRLLIIDTSGLDAFDAARAFYAALGYEKEARIRDYWADGDDKITFRKRL